MLDIDTSIPWVNSQPNSVVFVQVTGCLVLIYMHQINQNDCQLLLWMCHDDCIINTFLNMMVCAYLLSSLFFICICMLHLVQINVLIIIILWKEKTDRANICTACEDHCCIQPCSSVLQHYVINRMPHPYTQTVQMAIYQFVTSTTATMVKKGLQENVGVCYSPDGKLIMSNHSGQLVLYFLISLIQMIVWQVVGAQINKRNIGSFGRTAKYTAWQHLLYCIDYLMHTNYIVSWFTCYTTHKTCVWAWITRPGLQHSGHNGHHWMAHMIP